MGPQLITSLPAVSTYHNTSYQSERAVYTVEHLRYAGGCDHTPDFAA